MKLLLDTHIFLWLISGDRQLSSTAASLITDPRNSVYLSVASIWEAVIKNQTGKLPLPQSPALYLARQREAHLIAPLGLDEATLQFLPQLPLLHRDPFDRILICQALQHGLTLVTVDANIRDYAVPTTS